MTEREQADLRIDNWLGGIMLGLEILILAAVPIVVLAVELLR